MAEKDPVPRLAPGRALPPYAFVPGRTPHPRRDPRGHAYGRTDPAPRPLDPDRWADSPAYLHGLDLFNRGFYWEAHEAWESLWIASGRTGAVAEFLRGLIRLAAAGVKTAAGSPGGRRRHLEGAAARLDRSRELSGRTDFAGLRLDRLAARALAEAAASGGAGGSRAFSWILVPAGADADPGP